MPKFNCEILALSREARGLTQVDLSRLLGVEQGTISKIENGKMEMPEHLIDSVALYLEKPRNLFFSEKKVIKVEGRYRKKASLAVKEVKQFVAKMTFTEWHINKLSDAIELPKPNIPSWDIEVDGDAKDAARYVREYWKIPRGRINDLASILEDNGIIIAALDLGDMDGLSTYSAEYHIPILYINKNRSADRIRHTSAHEAAHYILHYGKKIPPHRDEKDIEDEANAFASELLMPENEILPQLTNLNIEKLGDLKRYWKVSMQSVLYKAEKIGAITQNQARYLWTQIGKLGYRTKEPFDIQPDSISLLRELLDTHLDELKYSKEDVADLLGMTVYSLETTYYDAPITNKIHLNRKVA